MSGLRTNADLLLRRRAMMPSGEEPVPPTPTVKNYLTFEATQDSTEVTFSCTGVSVAKTIEVSTDGETWTEKTASMDGTFLATLNSGEKLYVRGENIAYCDEYENRCNFSASGPCYVYGNIMSLIGGDDFENLTEVSSRAFEYMFYGFTGLLSKDGESLLLPAIALAGNCYKGMFGGCTGLTIAPELPATTLAEYCYAFMFYGCTGLTTAPELPATTLAKSCYSDMFNGCTGLTTAPELPATTLAERCYPSMFTDCTHLASVTCLATDISATYATADWLYGVAASGTFTKAAGVNWSSGESGIPSGWTVVEAPSGEEPVPPTPTVKNYLTIEATQDSTAVSFNAYDASFVVSIEVSTDGETWEEKTASTAGTALATLNTGDKLYLRGENAAYCDENENSCYPVADKSCYVYGNIMSMIGGENFEELDSVGDYAFAFFFDGTDGAWVLSKADEPLVLPATTLGEGCYYEMFFGCTGLTAAPELPATTLAEYCYRDMFYGCTGLTAAPDLPATTLAEYCYNRMFYGCTSLASVTCLATSISASYATSYWLYDVAATGTFTKAAGVNWSTGTSGIPSGWTVIEQ